MNPNSMMAKRIMIIIPGLLVVLFTSAQSTGKVKDIEGNEYPTMIIGNQEWMTENLRTTRLNDGSPIPLETSDQEWRNLISPAYCWYNNDESGYKNAYGALYNWYAVGTEKLCPRGWHVPSEEEWHALKAYLGGKTLAGGKLKSGRTSPDDHPRWNKPNTGATGESKFNALPGGFRYIHLSRIEFTGIGEYGKWWSSTGTSTGVAWCRLMYSNYSHLSSFTTGKPEGMSVRCLKN